jgi:aminopeptidase N
MARLDPHSYTDSDQPRIERFDWSARVDFDRRVLDGEARLHLAEPTARAQTIDLDTRDLQVARVFDEGGANLRYAIHGAEPILGRRLSVDLPAATRSFTVHYATSPSASALGWLDPAQTLGRKHPFLFSQCQAIHARSIVPVQDSPAARFTYDALVTVPDPLNVVMSAASNGLRPGPRGGTRTGRFDMPQPIPPYLLALAVGDFVARDLSPRSRVYAEPVTIEAAAWEFAEIEAMLGVAERLFGPYPWERYDMLVLPPSFPYGGMENPRMTFLTPTLLAGDRSLVDVVAHELAHSWTGNLVTNASAEHFWLNEGTTVYAERRIQEALHGREAAALAWTIGRQGLEADLERLRAHPEWTRLRQHLEGTDPDEAFSTVPYEKGARLWALIEETAGRERLDFALRAYIERFAFTSITTEDWRRFVDEHLPGVLARLRVEDWLDGPGLPPNEPRFAAAALERQQALAARVAAGTRPGAAELSDWTTAETLVFLNALPRRLDQETGAWLDAALGLTARGNYEVLVAWLTLAIASDYEPARHRVREVLTNVGRMKYLRPLYTALARNPRTFPMARDIFAEAAPGYHPLSRRVASTILEEGRDKP